MIPRGYIADWRPSAPWATDAQVEQDLALCRALTDLFSDDALRTRIAFRGGTALHKLWLQPAGRYSEDIDLVQVDAEPIGEVMSAIRDRLDPWLGRPQWKQGRGLTTFYYRFQSEIPPIVRLRLKVEINTREHFSVLGLQELPFRVDSPWYTGDARVLTYRPEELLGTKLRALYQRRKGRDLFDLDLALNRLPDLDRDQLISCFAEYVSRGGQRVSRLELEENVRQKLADDVFLSDVPPLLRAGVDFDANRAFERVNAELIARVAE